MRKGQSLKSQLVHQSSEPTAAPAIDAEGLLDVNIEGTVAPSTTLASNVEFRINNNRLKAFDLESEATAAADLLNDIVDTVEEVQESIEEVKENLDDMSPIAIGAALQEIKSQAEEIVDLAEDKIDAEARIVDPRGSANLDLEGIGDALKSVGETIKNAFKSSKTKAEEGFKASAQWEKDNSQRLTSISGELKAVPKDAKLKENASDIANSKMGNKLAAIRSLDINVKDLPAYASGLLSLDSKTSEDSVAGVIKSSLSRLGIGVKGVDLVSVSRIDGIHVGVALLSKADGKVGFAGYDSSTIPRSLLKTKKDLTSELTIANAASLLDIAKKLNSIMPSVVSGLSTEINTIEGMLAGDIEKAKFEKGPLFKMGAWNWFFIAAGALPGIGKAAFATSMKIVNKVNAAKMAIGDSSNLIGVASLIEASRDGKKTFEELEAKEKYRVLNARVKLTSKYAVDALFGLQNLINELIDYAKIIIDLHSSNVDKEDLEEVELTINVNLPEGGENSEVKENSDESNSEENSNEETPAAPDVNVTVVTSPDAAPVDTPDTSTVTVVTSTPDGAPDVIVNGVDSEKK